ncbi:MAG: alpha/beta hydrolase [Clostridiales bacterium]|nr:alpha/beta hydrolase [Clostridiales bacterium]
MKSEIISKARRYNVPCLYNINGQEQIVCVIIHGFGSSKNSVTATMMLEELPRAGIGAIAFDLPAHGESEVDGASLRLFNCLEDLEAVESRARALAPQAEIVYFASSFGAYIALIYLSQKKQGKPRAFLRSPAVNMPEILSQGLTPELRARLETTGELILDKDVYGYARDLKLTQGFFDDLQGHDVFTLWREGMATLYMVHGEADETVLLSDVQSFARRFHVPLTIVPDGDHQLSMPGMPECVLKLATAFFSQQIPSSL